MTVNKCTNLESYPIPKIEYLYTKLSPGRKNTKLDLRSAFLQVSLHKDSKKFLTINTPRGLYLFNHFLESSLPWHISTFHRQPFREGTICCKLSGWHSNRIFRRRTSRQLRVLKKLSDSSLRGKLDECKFMAPSVTYLGHRIVSEGLHPTEDKIQAIRDAPT